ncbi:hypothetical protein MAC_09163 [Metarhizium acridum CQMa 102]|uniref:DUF3626 domain-containing protein n=1 Tax=Metarhizium acridum (strain CQMa 102) TaxID=655827 RepID=E9EH15_METAQ|nr:uncharacterized protein MAC_09163 [Metarhizium acridum CQMa 102]EFY84800.1 hypothetical protein MAC_09163 [Metarhizium acridum CQMa 102]
MRVLFPSSTYTEGSHREKGHTSRTSSIEYFKLHQAGKEVRNRARIALHFHPDRPVGDGTVASALLEDGLYRNQFETGISSGLVAAFRGSPRDQWENSLFEDAYSDHRVSLAHRPKYGALDLANSVDGPAPRFGSCYFLLKPAVSKKSAFTSGGSQDAPKLRGTLDLFAPILQALLEESFTRDFMLGISGIRPPQVVDRLCNLYGAADTRSASPSRNLDHIIEAQIHGDIRLARDVDTLVVDGGSRSTGIGRCLEGIGRKYKFTVQYYQGFKLDVQSVPLDFRGPSMPSLARRVNKDGFVDTAAIGLAVQHLARSPHAWADRGTYSEVLQELKLLLHVLVRYGWCDMDSTNFCLQAS